MDVVPPAPETDPRPAPGAALAGSVALVTGAGSGIGAELAAGLARAGAAVGLVGRRPGPLEATAARVAQEGGRALVAAADVTDRAAVAAAVGATEGGLGPVDLLVNAAGRIEQAEVPVWAADPEEWWEVVAASLLGPFTTVQAVVPGMVARGGGRVVELTSGYATRDTPVYSAYAAGKAADLRLTGCLAAAGEAHGVRAFAVAPGVVRTAMTAAMPVHAGRPEGAWTPVERVADLVLAIAAGDLDALSGRYLRADRDDVETLRAAADRIAGGPGRRLVVAPWGDDDPLA